MISRSDHAEQQGSKVTHVSSLPHTPEVIEANKRREDAGGAIEGFDEILTNAAVAVVQEQKDVAITIIGDCEYGHAMSGPINYGTWWSWPFHQLGGTELCVGELNTVIAVIPFYRLPEAASTAISDCFKKLRHDKPAPTGDSLRPLLGINPWHAQQA